jgi:hypothetical protein
MNSGAGIGAGRACLVAVGGGAAEQPLGHHRAALVADADE